MKKIFVLLIFILFVLGINAQEYDIQFSKFKLEWFNVMGFRGGGNGQRLKLTFKNLSGTAIKYVTVHYWALNSVGDIETDQFNRKEFSTKCTGPFVPKKSNKLEVEIALFHPTLLMAYPNKVEIIFMNDEEKEIEINKDNIGNIFPTVEYKKIGNIESLK